MEEHVTLRSMWGSTEIYCSLRSTWDLNSYTDLSTEVFGNLCSTWGFFYGKPCPPVNMGLLGGQYPPSNVGLYTRKDKLSILHHGAVALRDLVNVGHLTSIAQSFFLSQRGATEA